MAKPDISNAFAIAPRQEIQDAIDTVERLEQALDAIV
jgi:hypothetical protein